MCIDAVLSDLHRLIPICACWTPASAIYCSNLLSVAPACVHGLLSSVQDFADDVQQVRIEVQNTIQQRLTREITTWSDPSGEGGDIAVPIDSC